MSKLVRDGIPAKIRQNGETPALRIAPPWEMAQLLRAKLIEEANEAAAPNADLAMELADVLEVVASLAALQPGGMGAVEKAREVKRRELGGFGMRYVLEFKERAAQ